MIVTCQNCDTSFQLDESRVPVSGIRVRCSRCKEAFFLAHPSASEAEAIHDVALEAAVAGGSPSLDATQDLPPSARVMEAVQEPPAVATDEDDEHDWEFNLDPPSGEGVAEESEHDQKIGNGLTSSVSSDGSGLSLAGEGDENDETAANRLSDFGSVDDYSSLMEEEETEEPETASMESAAPSGAAAIDVSSAPISDAGHYATSSVGDDLGDPESWDFFGDAQPADSLAGSGAVLGRVALTSSPVHAFDGVARLPGQTAEWDDEPFEDAEEEVTAGPLLRSLGHLGHMIGWAATLSLVSVIVVSGFRGTAESLVSSPQDIELGQLEARGITGRWVDTARGETLLSVRGRLVNPASSLADLGGILEVVLLDSAGRPLDLDPQPAGTVLAEEEVRELTPEALRLAIDRAAFGLAQENLAPNDPVFFQALFRNVPVEAVRFSLSIADGHPTIHTGGQSGRIEDSGAVTVEGMATLRPTVDTGAVTGPAARLPIDSGELTWGE